MLSKSDLLATAIGRRKTAVAIVQVYKATPEESSKIMINDCFAEVFLQFNPAYLKTLSLPLALLELEGVYQISVKTRGGGLTGQTQAIVLGLARALCQINASYRPTLKAAGLLTRDSRSVERKKYGLKKARKASQYSKR
uniref:Small ribosomal subunit protein uS9c n=1 Tax=Aureoumbra lagunensis TaxID=44058 RepID=C6KIW3_9STRA|nr:30S ribosomal protein S9 [Aureoumbra lagunensis]ACS36919.1 30S ribosomal protein S9 [Aureoumbra lagunensis]